MTPLQRALRNSGGMLVVGVWLGVGAVVVTGGVVLLLGGKTPEKGAAPGFNRRDSAADALQRHGTMSLYVSHFPPGTSK